MLICYINLPQKPVISVIQRRDFLTSSFKASSSTHNSVAAEGPFCIYNIIKSRLYSRLPESQLASGIFIYLYQMTPLHLAAERGHYKTAVVSLVDNGANVDMRDDNEVNTFTTTADLSFAHERGHCIHP